MKLQKGAAKKGENKCFYKTKYLVRGLKSQERLNH